MDADASYLRFARLRKVSWVLAAVGPGIMVMLADTDAGSVITAAQSGAEWGYRMLLPLVILIPILYVIQEITVRLGALTGKGHGALIRERYGMKWAMLSVGTLFLSAVGALVTEFSGIAGASQLFGVPGWLSVSIATILLIFLGLSGSYRRVERVGIAVGLFELVFILMAVLAHPNPQQLVAELASVPWRSQSYMFLLAANVGAVIMPWMIFYQQGAVIDKRLTITQVGTARWDTVIGAIVSQVLMIAVVVATAATIGQSHPNHPLNDVAQIASTLTPVLGRSVANTLFGLGMLGASFIAALVVSIAGAWGIGEAFAFKHSLNDRPREAKWFYAIYSFAHVGGALLVIFSLNLVALAVDVEVMNAMLLPIVLGFLLLLEARVLPVSWRMKGVYKYTVWTISGVVMAFGVYMAGVML